MLVQSPLSLIFLLIVLDKVVDTSTASDSNIAVAIEDCSKLLTHSSAAIRLAALGFLVSSGSGTKPFHPAIFANLRKTFPYFFAETDTEARNDVMAITKRIVQRLRGALAHLERALAKLHSHAQRIEIGHVLNDSHEFRLQLSRSAWQDQIAQHASFLEWYAEFLCSELRPTASYQRHITALKALQIFVQSDMDQSLQNRSPEPLESRESWTSPMHNRYTVVLRALYDLSTDPFDDVRALAAAVLKMMLPAHPQDVLSTGRLSSNSREISNTTEGIQGYPAPPEISGQPNLLAVLERAQKVLLRTGRADHGDGVARLYDVLDACIGRNNIYTKEESSGCAWWSSTTSIVDRLLLDLENGLSLARENLRQAVARAPVHGYLAALR